MRNASATDLVLRVRRHRLLGLTRLSLLAVVLGGCSESNTPSEPDPDPALGPEPVLWNLAVDFDAAFDVSDV